MKAKDFQSRQKKAYLIFFSCAAVLIILLIMVCAFAFGRNAQSAEHSASSAASPTTGGFITFPPVSDTAETTQTAAPSNSDVSSSATAAPLPSEPIYPEQSALLQFTGDVVLHSEVLSYASQTDYSFDEYFESIKKYLTGDMVFANLEGVIEGGGDYSGYPLFNYPDSIASALKNAGITNVITANDRAFDKLASGIVSTRQALSEAGLDAVGTYTSAEEAAQPYIKEVNGIKIGVIAYSDGTNNMDVHMPEEYLDFAMKLIDWNDIEKTAENIKEDIAQCRESGAELVVLSLHWGTEYTYSQSDEQRQLAQLVLESGADIIMGTRSHMVQPITVKNVQVDGRDKKVAVMYSLGNFFADQYDLNQERTQAGAIVNIRVSRNVYTNQIELDSVEYIPTYIYKYTNNDGSISYSVIAPDEYAGVEEPPEPFVSSEDWARCRDAVGLVEQTIGSAAAKAELE